MKHGVSIQALIIGSVILLEKTGTIPHATLSQWWPILLIFAGGWQLVRRVGRDKT
jgi:uncharacterized membrane protein